MRSDIGGRDAADEIAQMLEDRLGDLEEALPRRFEEIEPHIRTALDAYYHKDYLPLLCSLTEDALFIGAGPDVVRGRQALINACGDDADTPSFHMNNFRLEVEPLGISMRAAAAGDAEGVREPDLVVATATYDLFSEGDQPMLTAVRQRLTLLIRFEGSAWRTFYLHSSNEWGELVQDEVFPVQVSSQTYEYVNHILRIANRGGSEGAGTDVARGAEPNARPRAVRLAIRDGVHAIDSGEVLYIKATGRTCEAHTPNGVVVLPCSLSVAEGEFRAEGFRRIHRSYLVSAAAVERLEGLVMTLVNGEQIGIPRRRRAEVRAWLLGRDAGPGEARSGAE